jgi:hypothetical protein
MNSRILSIIFILLFLVFNPSTQAIATQEDVYPDIPTCSMLAASSTMNYAINIGPDISTARFALIWKNEASKIKMDIQTPDGEWIRPERDSLQPTKRAIHPNILDRKTRDRQMGHGD